MPSIREIAEQVTTDVAKICGCNWESCTKTRNATTDAIEQALRDERERAAKIPESRAKELGRMALAPLLDDETVARFRSQSAVCHELVDAIRKED